MADALIQRKAIDIITRAMRTLGRLQPGEVPADDVAQHCLLILQELVDTWKAERLMIKVIDRHTYPIVSGQASYTIGPGANFDQERPEYVTDAGVITTSVNPNFELPLDVIDDDEFAAISIKGLQSALPKKLYYDYAFAAATGYGNVFLFPIPNVGNLTLALYSATALGQFADLSQTSYRLPPAYARALHYNLAVELVDDLGRPMTPSLAKLAVDSKAVVQRVNYRSTKLRVDPSLGPSGGAFNWLTGESGGR